MLNSDLCVGQYIVANLKKPFKNPTLLLPRRYNIAECLNIKILTR